MKRFATLSPDYKPLSSQLCYCAYIHEHYIFVTRISRYSFELTNPEPWFAELGRRDLAPCPKMAELQASPKCILDATRRAFRQSSIFFRVATFTFTRNFIRIRRKEMAHSRSRNVHVFVIRWLTRRRSSRRMPRFYSRDCDAKLSEGEQKFGIQWDKERERSLANEKIDEEQAFSVCRYSCHWVTTLSSSTKSAT